MEKMVRIYPVGIANQSFIEKKLLTEKLFVYGTNEKFYANDRFHGYGKYVHYAG